jgi:hypothetical protein
MHSVEESLLRSRHSVRKRNRHRKRKSKHKREVDRKRDRARAMNRVEYIQSKKACYEAVIQSGAKPTLLQKDKEQAQERD